MTFLSPSGGTANKRLLGPLCSVLLLMVLGLVLAVLRVGVKGQVAGGCWVSASLLKVAVTVTGARCGSYSSSRGVGV